MRVDDLVAATTVVAPSGAWEVSLPPLAPGNRTLSAYQVDASGTQSSPSPPVSIAVVDVAPLDFSGVGRTAVTAWRRVGRRVTLKHRYIGDSTWEGARLPGRYPAPGDYDGDGITDRAAVQIRGDALAWSITSSSSKQTRRISFGSPGDTIITGCKLTGASPLTMTIFQERKRRFLFRDFDSAARGQASLRTVLRGDLLGCGDVDGDGVDEIIFEVDSNSPRTARIEAIDVMGRVKMSLNVPAFVRGYLVPRGGTDVPYVALLQPTLASGLPIRVATLAGTFVFPVLHVKEGSTVAMGLFGDAYSQQVPGAVWSEPRTGMIQQRLFTKDARVTRLFKIPKGYRLLRPGQVFRTKSRRGARHG